MDWLKDRVGLLIGSGIGVGAINFFANLLLALSDGHLDDQELHHLLGGASGAQVMLLGLVYFLTKKKPS